MSLGGSIDQRATRSPRTRGSTAGRMLEARQSSARRSINAGVFLDSGGRWRVE
jgi:hypothetical protein